MSDLDQGGIIRHTGEEEEEEEEQNIILWV